MNYSRKVNRLSYRDVGATLFMSLVILLFVLLAGTSLASLTLIGERSARNEHDRALALAAAESALIDAELDIENSTANTSRSSIFSLHATTGFSRNCGKGEKNIYQGLCFASKNPANPIWYAIDIANTSTNSASVQFGRFTGRTMPSGQGPLPSQLPRYLIELMLDTSPGQPTEPTYLYRITAIGFGPNVTTQVVVQSFYRKAS